MVFHTSAWVLLSCCSVAGAAYAVVRELPRSYYARYQHWRDARGSFLATVFSATLLGLGAGMGVGFVLLAVAAVVVQIQS